MSKKINLSRRYFLKVPTLSAVTLATMLSISPKLCNIFSIKNTVAHANTASSKEFTSEGFLKEMRDWFVKDEGNFFGTYNMLPSEFKGTQVYEPPIFGIGDANDPLFIEFSQSPTIGTRIIPPSKQLAGAQSVITVFAPFVKAIREENATNPLPNDKVWRTAYSTGESHLGRFAQKMNQRLAEYGYATITPAWSHRHVGFICGIGTFSLAKHIITEKGGCGRMISLITTAPLTVTKRTYSDIYEHCIRCKACESRCSTGAIDFSQTDHNIKNHYICRQHYTCGKCQTGVPCAHSIPQKA